jgi:hypothetical protein
MVIKTKKYQLDTGLYIKKSMLNIAKEWWWAWLIPIAIFAIFFTFGLWGWGLGVSITLLVLYVLFWLAQFTAITQHENSKMLFDKYAYEITSKQILMKINARKGMPINWSQIKKAQKSNDAFTLSISRAQLIYLPFDIFKSTTEIRFLESILKRKNLLKGVKKIKE